MTTITLVRTGNDYFVFSEKQLHLLIFVNSGDYEFIVYSVLFFGYINC